MKILYEAIDGTVFDSEHEAFRHERDLRKSAEVNITQGLIFDLITRCSFNGFDGPEIVKFFLGTVGEWQGVVPEIEDVTLRDIDEDFFFVDTIRVRCLTQEATSDLFKKIKKHLHPDECDIENDKRTIRLWWD